MIPTAKTINVIIMPKTIDIELLDIERICEYRLNEQLGKQQTFTPEEIEEIKADESYYIKAAEDEYSIPQGAIINVNGRLKEFKQTTLVNKSQNETNHHNIFKAIAEQGEQGDSGIAVYRFKIIKDENDKKGESKFYVLGTGSGNLKKFIKKTPRDHNNTLFNEAEMAGVIGKKQHASEICEIIDENWAVKQRVLTQDFINGKSGAKQGAEYQKLNDPNKIIAYQAKALSQVLEQLVVLHENNIIHADIKPENIMFSENGNASLVDFGCARRGEIGQDLSGTRAYFPPEYFSIDKRTFGNTNTFDGDIFQLGLSFIEILVGNTIVENRVQGYLIYLIGLTVNEEIAHDNMKIAHDNMKIAHNNIQLPKSLKNNVIAKGFLNILKEMTANESHKRPKAKESLNKVKNFMFENGLYDERVESAKKFLEDYKIFFKGLFENKEAVLNNIEHHKTIDKYTQHLEDLQLENLASIKNRLTPTSVDNAVNDKVLIAIETFQEQEEVIKAYVYVVNVADVNLKNKKQEDYGRKNVLITIALESDDLDLKIATNELLESNNNPTYEELNQYKNKISSYNKNIHSYFYAYVLEVLDNIENKLNGDNEQKKSLIEAVKSMIPNDDSPATITRIDWLLQAVKLLEKNDSVYQALNDFRENMPKDDEQLNKALFNLNKVILESKSQLFDDATVNGHADKIISRITKVYNEPKSEITETSAIDGITQSIGLLESKVKPDSYIKNTKKFTKSKCSKAKMAGMAMLGLAGTTCLFLAGATIAATAGVSLPASFGLGLLGQSLLSISSIAIGSALITPLPSYVAAHKGQETGTQNLFNNFATLFKKKDVQQPQPVQEDASNLEVSFNH